MEKNLLTFSTIVEIFKKKKTKKTMTKEQMRRDIDKHITQTKNINSKKVGNKAKAWAELKALAIITEVNKG